MSDPVRALSPLNLYHDTDYRMRYDPEFRAVVDQLVAAALTHGYTPGELKQIAFAAAMRAEQLAEHRYPLLMPSIDEAE